MTDWLGNDAWLDGDVVAGSPAVWERIVAVTADVGERSIRRRLQLVAT